MSLSTPPTTAGKSLFSQHYLETRLPAQPEWLEDPQPALDAAIKIVEESTKYRYGEVCGGEAVHEWGHEPSANAPVCNSCIRGQHSWMAPYRLSQAVVGASSGVGRAVG